VLWVWGLVVMMKTVNPGVREDLTFAALCLQPMIPLGWAFLHRYHLPTGRLVALAFTALATERAHLREAVAHLEGVAG